MLLLYLKEFFFASGPDGGQFDYVAVYTQSETVKCFFHKYLDDNDFELGSGCTVVKRHSKNVFLQ